MESRRLRVLKLDAERTRSFSNVEAFTDMISMTGSRQNMSWKKKGAEPVRGAADGNVMFRYSVAFTGHRRERME
jgi:hypothetical protein